jgi:hypothetical protein
MFNGRRMGARTSFVALMAMGLADNRSARC